MKFGIFHIVPWHESRTQEQALREALEQLRDTGQTVATARTTLVQPFDPLTLGDRIEEILGWGA